MKRSRRCDAANGCWSAPTPIPIALPRRCAASTESARHRRCATARNASRCRLTGEVEATAARVVAALVAANIHVFSVAPEQRDLETVFREVSDAGEAA